MSSAQVPEGYKQTEVGVIPEEWKAKKLGEFVSLQRGHDLTDRERRPGNVPVMGAAGQNGYHDTALVQSPGIVLGRSGASFGQVHYCNKDYWPHNTGLYATDFHGNDPLFTFYFLDLLDFSQYNSGGAQQSLNRNFIYPILISVPPPTEQRAIAQALSDVDALIASLDKLIAKQRQLKTAAMQQLLTGKMRLPGFEGKWQTVSMNKHASIKARIGWQALTTEEYLDTGSFILVTGTDFLKGRVNWSTCHFVDEWRYSQDKNIQLRSSDVLLTKDGTIGKVGYVENLPIPATLNSGVFVLRPLNESFYPLFLYYVLSSQIFEEFLNKIFAGSTISHLYQKDFVTFEFLAPLKEEQRAIATVLSDMDSAIAVLETRRAKTQAIKQGMMQELLTGRTRLV